MSAESKVVPISSKTEVVAERQRQARLQEVMQRVQQQTTEQLHRALVSCLEQVDDALFTLADRAGSNTLQAVYFDALREVRLRRRNVEAGFRKEVEQGFRSFAQDPHGFGVKREPREPPEAADFSLVDDAALEEQVAVDAMVAKAQNTYALPLAHLQVRLSWLAGDTKLTDLPSPMSPGPVCEAFRTSVATLEMDIRARLTLFKLFERLVVGELGTIYDDVNRLLVDAGVLPDLQSRRPQQTRRRDADQRRAPQAPADREETEELAAEDAEVLNLLRELVGQRRSGTVRAESAPPGTGARPVPSRELVQVLSGLQRDRAGLAAARDADERFDIRALLQERWAAHGPGPAQRAVGRLDDDVIDIVGLLFEFVLDDHNLPAPVKGLLARLQIPMIKVAVLDRTFFSKRTHPARRLLNELAQAGLGWTEGAQAGRSNLLTEIEHVVNRVLTEFDDDVGLFSRLLEQFQAFIQEERRRAEVVEQRTRQAEQGKSRLAEARKRVDDEIAARLPAGRPLPEVAQTVLKDAWSRVLFITYLQDGPDSARWERNLATADTLLWSLTPKRNQEERKRLLTTIPGLLQELRAGLTGISYNPVEMSKLFRALQVCHINSLRNVEPAPVATAPAPAAASARSAEVPAAEPPPPAATREPVAALAVGPAGLGAAVPAAELYPDSVGPAAAPAVPVQEAGQERAEGALGASRAEVLASELAEVDRVSAGTWIEFQEADGTRQRARLSARLEDVEEPRLLFVNRSGVKVLERTREALALDLHHRRASVLDDRLLFDRALEAVVGSLRVIGTGKVT